MPTLFCDINETTLDLAPLRPLLEEHLGEGAAPLWFARLVHHSTVMTLTDSYLPFPELGAAAFASVAESLGRDGSGWPRVAAAFGTLPAHPDVASGLERFRVGGWGVVALTNTPLASLERGLAAAGIDHLFDRLLTVEAVGRFKPAPEVYRYALAVTDVEPSEGWMVAAHDWDLAGAGAVGMRTAFLARPGTPLSPAYPEPDVVATDYRELADALLRPGG